MNNKDILAKIGTAKKHTIKKRQLNLLGYIMKKENLQNLTFAGHINDKRNWENEFL